MIKFKKTVLLVGGKPTKEQLNLLADAEIISKEIQLVTNTTKIKETAIAVRQFLDEIESLADYVVVIPQQSDSPIFWLTFGAYLAVEICLEQIIALIGTELIEFKL